MRLQGALTAGVLTCALLLAGCTSDAPTAEPSPDRATASPADPAPTPSSTAVPSPTPSPTPTLGDVSVEPTPPPTPESSPSKDDAVAFAQYYISLFPYAFATGDTSAWDKFRGENCGYCRDITDAAAEDHRKGWHDVGGQIEHVHGSASKFDDGTYFVTLVFNEHASVKLDESGEVVKEFPGTQILRAEIYLLWSGKAWSVDGVKIDPVEN